jgi:Sortase domain
VSWGAGDMPAPARTIPLTVVTLLLTTGLAGAQPAGPVGRERPVAARSVAAAVGTPAGAPSAADAFRSARTYHRVAAPVRLRVPDLGIDSRLESLGQSADGTVAVPERADVAGWYADGPRPGQRGPAVILGHVDSRAGPGIFMDLSRLSRGAVVHVDRADGSTVTFRVTTVSRVPKTHFPTDEVYGPTLQPTLRLITCGGSFDQARRSYRDNVIVFATPA